MKKQEMTEEDIKLQYITLAIEGAGWDKLKQIKMEYNFTDGRVIVRGNVTARGKRKRTDYLLYYKPNIPLAIVEAKDNKHSIHNAIISHPALPGTFCAVLPQINLMTLRRSVPFFVLYDSFSAMVRRKRFISAS